MSRKGSGNVLSPCCNARTRKTSLTQQRICEDCNGIIVPSECVFSSERIRSLVLGIDTGYKRRYEPVRKDYRRNKVNA